MELFSIVCPTCNARLKVRNAAAIGQILNCPKCASMVQVEAPAGWQPPAAGATATSEPDMAEPPAGSAATRRRWENEVQPGEKVAPAASASGSSGGWQLGSSSGALSSPDSSSVARPSRPSSESPSLEGPPTDAPAAAGSIARLSEMGWLKWAIVGGMPTAIIAALTIAWLSWREPASLDVPPAETEVVADHAAADAPANVEAESQTAEAPAAAEQTEPLRLSRRWLPAETKAMVILRPEQLLSQPAANLLLNRTAALWQPQIGKLASALSIEPDSFERVTWAVTEVASIAPDDWLTNAVVTLELMRAPPADWRALAASEPLDWKLGDAPARALKSRAWPHPFAIVDERTIVTGPEAPLRALVDRDANRLADDSLDQLIDGLDARQSIVSAIGLRAWREAEALPLGATLVDVLHADAEDWQLLRAMPLAAGFVVSLDQRLRLELSLACDGQSSAEQVQAALERVFSAVEKTLDEESEGLTDNLLAGEINAALAGDLKRFLAGSQTALSGRSSGLRDAIVWTRLEWQGDLPQLISGFLASVPQIEASRMAAARRLDEEHHRGLLLGLEAYVKAEGAFPAGAAGASLLPPDTRLSWQAMLLPYYGHLDWHGELNFARAWNDPHNAHVTRRPLELMVNPALGPSQTKGGFPITHYVGVAGLGTDAGALDADDARAGVFGFRSRYVPARMPDGASNTIALAGVAQKLGPWSRGGNSTVRGFTQTPYIDGPDGFGSGQGNGMLVGMADGSVRFLSKDIDAEVFQHLVTVAGADATAELAESKQPLAVDKPMRSRGQSAPQPSPRKEPKADLDEHLGQRVASIELTDTTLAELVDLLSQMSTIPISLDAPGLAAAGVAPDAPVSLSLSDASVEEILEEALRNYELKYIQVGNQLVVTDGRQSQEMLTASEMNVSDLASSQSDGERLVGLIETLVAPTSWQSAGGTGSVQFADRSLKLEQTPKIHDEVADFLDKLRMARELPILRPAGRRLSLATRWARARDKLTTSITANFAEPTRLREVCNHLQTAAGIEIVFDGLRLAEAGVAPAARTKFAADQQPLSEALDQLLKPLGLGYRIASGQRLEVTSARQAEVQLELEFYRVPPPLAAERDRDGLTARISQTIAPAAWRHQKGSAELTLDALSGYLIVLAPQAVQIELERWLDAQAAEDGK